MTVDDETRPEQQIQSARVDDGSIARVLPVGFRLQTDPNRLALIVDRRGNVGYAMLLYAVLMQLRTNLMPISKLLLIWLLMHSPISFVGTCRGGVSKLQMTMDKRVTNSA